jgi:hypothetical protein
VHHATNDVMTVEVLLHSFSNFCTRCVGGGGRDAPDPLPRPKQGGAKTVP